MAAPAIPPIRLGLTGTGLPVAMPRWPALCGLAGTSSERRVTRGGSDATTHTTVFPVPGQRISGSASFVA